MVYCGSIILAGGVGKRLGHRKQNVELGPKKLLHHVLDTAVQLSNEIVVVYGNENESSLSFDYKISESSPRETFKTVSGR